MKPVTRVLQHTLMLLIVFSGSVVDASQHRKPRTVLPKLTDSVFERWVEFKSKGGKFTIFFPASPKTHSPDDEPSGHVPMYYATYQSTIKYSAMYIDYPESLEAPIVAKDV